MTEQQKYLIQRLPNIYNLKVPVVSEPAKVIQARKTIAEFEEKNQKTFSERRKKFLKMRTAVNEAIYFKPSGDALNALRALESEFPEFVK